MPAHRIGPGAARGGLVRERRCRELRKHRRVHPRQGGRGGCSSLPVVVNACCALRSKRRGSPLQRTRFVCKTALAAELPSVRSRASAVAAKGSIASVKGVWKRPFGIAWRIVGPSSFVATRNPAGQRGGLRFPKRSRSSAAASTAYRGRGFTNTVRRVCAIVGTYGPRSRRSPSAGGRGWSRTGGEGARRSIRRC